MKLRLLLLLPIILPFLANAQIVTISPANASLDDEITITYDATLGSPAGLVGADKVYMHSGVVLENKALPTGADWSSVVGNWGEDDGIGEMTKVDGEDNKWQITLSPDARSYYGLEAGADAFYLAMVFRNADGTAEGKGEDGDFGIGIVNNGDIFVRLNAGSFVFLSGLDDSYFVEEGATINYSAEVSGPADTIVSYVVLPGGSNLPLNNTLAPGETSQSISYTVAAEGVHKFITYALIGNDSVSTSKDVSINLLPDLVQIPLPAGLKQGVNYHDDDPTKATFVLLAPNKDFVYMAGTMNDWTISSDYLMNQDTGNPELYWLELTGLEAGKEYIYQYWVNGEIKIGDPYGEKVVDPWNDEFIPESVYPGLIEFTNRDLGIATTFQTDQTEFMWDVSEESWERPDKQNLVIYELLVRDFLGSHSYQDLIDTIPYLKDLGINAIELMPIMEFEGNESWGYNPSYFFAVDKYYGTSNDLKEFIQTAHQNGMAVILDMVLNHAFGQNAMVRMDWDPSINNVSENSVWFNQEAPHPFSVGFDFNHESQYTKDFVDDVNRYWIEEFHFDGYRFDLTKGFTQQQSNESSASNYDQSRVDILVRMADEIWKIDEEAYVILEHFTTISEESVLRQAGMMTWGNNNHDYRNLLKGDLNQNISSAAELSRVSYMESHDEERVAWEMKSFGRSGGGYDIKDPSVYLERSMLGAAFFFTLPGPKMMWQFQELGYDIELNDDRLAKKPLPWGTGNLGYYEDEDRQKVYDVYGAIIGMTQQFEDAFRSGTLSTSLSGTVKTIKLVHEDINVVIVGNFELSNQGTIVDFGTAGTWFDYLTGDELVLSEATWTYQMAPGEFHIFTDIPLEVPGEDLVSFTLPDENDTVTDIDDLENNSFAVYPTVSSGSLMIRTADGETTEMEVSLTSLSGQEFLRIAERHGSILDLNISDLPDGLYILRVTTSSGIRQTKIIKH